MRFPAVTWSADRQHGLPLTWFPRVALGLVDRRTVVRKHKVLTDNLVGETKERVDHGGTKNPHSVEVL